MTDETAVVAADAPESHNGRGRLGRWFRRGGASGPDAAERERVHAEREAARLAQATADAEREAARQRDEQAREERRARSRQAREAARARWAQRALAVPTVVWMETVLWLCTVAALAVAYALSYSHISEVFGQLDYGGWEHSVAPIALDLPLTAAIAGLYLTARWGSPWVPRWTFRGMTLLTAPLSLGANALHGCVANGQVNWHRVEEPVHLVSSLIPAVIVVACAFIAEVTFSEHARLDELAGRDPGGKNEPPDAPAGPTIDRAPEPQQDTVDAPSNPGPIVPPSSPSEPTIDRPESASPPRARRRSSRRSTRRSSRAAEPAERPPIDRLVEIIETIARERSVAPTDVLPAQALKRLEGYDDRSVVTQRSWVRDAKAAIVARSQPLTVVGEERA